MKYPQNADEEERVYSDDGFHDDPVKDDGAKALRISTRKHLEPPLNQQGEPSDGQPNTERRSRLVEWAYSFLHAPYEWGGGGYGGEIPGGTGSTDAHDDSGELGDQGWGIDCNGLVMQAMIKAGYPYNPPGDRLNTTHLASDDCTDSITWDQVRVGDILVKPGKHVVIVRSVGTGSGLAKDCLVRISFEQMVLVYSPAGQYVGAATFAHHPFAASGKGYVVDSTGALYQADFYPDRLEVVCWRP